MADEFHYNILSECPNIWTLPALQMSAVEENPEEVTDAELSSVLSTYKDSKLEFYKQADGSIRVRVYVTPGMADYELIISAADWITLKAAINGAGSSSVIGELGNMSKDFTVSV